MFNKNNSFFTTPYNTEIFYCQIFVKKNIYKEHCKTKNLETAAKESTLNVLSLRRRNETWLWQNATAFTAKP